MAWRKQYTGIIAARYATDAAKTAFAHAGEYATILIAGDKRDGAQISFEDGYTCWASWEELEDL